MTVAEITVYYRIRHLDDEEWRARLMTLSEVERVELDEMLKEHGLKSAITFWPDLLEVSVRPFADEAATLLQGQLTP